MDSSDDEDFVTYGEPLDPIDEDTIPKKKPITIADQYATDEHGRRRFHGAFTGGFTAGFCNTVGSLEGWQPSNFKSSRSTRADSVNQSIFDFMDAEDKSEHGICPMSLKVKPSFDDKSSVSSARKRAKEIASNGPIPGIPIAHQLFTPVKDTVGVKLLMKMGWRPGQGVGPRLTAKEKKRIRKQETIPKIYGCSLPQNASESNEEESSESDLDINLNEITFAPDDYKPYVVQPKQNSFGLGYKGMDRKPVLSSNKQTSSKLTVNGKTIHGHAFGVSVFEDDDDDIYSTDDMSNYDFSLIPANEPKCDQQKFSDDGCIAGFHIADTPVKLRDEFPLPTIPHDFVPLKSRKFRWESGVKHEPKKKITSVDERLRIMNDDVDTRKADKNDTTETNQEPVIPESVDQIPLPATPNYSFKPFSNDQDKQSRYEKFLMFKKLGLKNRLASIQPSSMTEWEKEREKCEFEQASRLYRPLSQDMADRFTTGAQEDVHDILTPVAKTIHSEDQTMKEAASKKIYGTLTRRKFSWTPDRILCKRFNVPEPAASGLQKAAENTKSKSHRPSIFEFLKSDSVVQPPKFDDSDEEVTASSDTQKLVTVEETLTEKDNAELSITKEDTQPEEIPDIVEKADLFKAIFLSSSEDEDESGPVGSEENQISDSTEKRNPLRYSPPRGIFANLDLDALKNRTPNPKTSSEVLSAKEITNTSACTPVEESNNSASTVLDSTGFGEDLYGPKIPSTLTPSISSIDKTKWIKKIKKESEAESAEWIEKSHKNKKHKKHKKHKSKHKK